MRISIIIPCYNECKTIEVILNKIKDLNNYEKEIIVIDDCSNDGTKEILENIKQDTIQKLILNEKNNGKGFCIKKGISVATGDIIIIQDADLEYDPNDYPKLIEPIKKNIADVVYGSRFMGSDERRVLFYWHTLSPQL